MDEKAGDPRFRYGRQQVIHRYDPSAIEEDLGDDPIKAADYGISNLKYILAHFEEWMPDSVDPDASLRTARYEALAKQYDRYLKAVIMNVGGIYLTSVKPGTEGRCALAVSKERQHESLVWVLDQLKDCSWINDRELTDKFSLRVELEPIFQYYTALEVCDTYKNVLLSAHIADSPQEAYTLRNWLDDMYKGIFGKDAKTKDPDDGLKILQKIYVSTIAGVAGKTGGQIVKVRNVSDDAYLPSVRHMSDFNMENTGFISKYIDVLSEYEAENGVGTVARQVSDNFGPAGYGLQYRVNTRTLDNSREMFYGECTKLARRLTSLASCSSGDAKAHYETLLKQVKAALR